MKNSLFLAAAATLLEVTLANTAARAACKADNCARAVTGTRLGTASHAAHLADCSSFLSYTVVPAIPTETTTVTPTETVTEYTTTVTYYYTRTSETVWPTTINTEVYQQQKRDDGATCSVASTISPTDLPAYAATACSASSRFSSACACAGVTPQYSTWPCYTARETVTAPPASTVTEFATYSIPQGVFITQTMTTALVDKIPCGQIIPIDEDLPAYKVDCEAQGVGNRTLIGSLNNTDWDNCVEKATWGLGAEDWEFDITSRVCLIYDRYPGVSGMNYSLTTPKKNHVYAYIYDGY